MATFNETRAQTSRKYVAKQGIVMPNCSKIIETFRSHSSVFALEKEAKNLNFEVFFLLLIDPLVTTFNETRSPTSRKDVAKDGIAMQNCSETLQMFWSHSSVFTLEN